MFHYRWGRDVDQISSAGRIARSAARSQRSEHARSAGQVRAAWWTGSGSSAPTKVTAPQIEAGFLDMLGLLDSHLADRPYLFGGRPSLGDFGLWADL